MNQMGRPLYENWRHDILDTNFFLTNCFIITCSIIITFVSFSFRCRFVDVFMEIENS